MSKLQTLAHFITIHGSTSLVLGTCAAALAWVLAKAVGRDHAGTRFMVWFSALLAIAAVFIAEPFGWTHGNTAPLIALPNRSALYLAAAWLAGTAFGLTRIMAGLQRVRRLRATLVELDPATLKFSPRTVGSSFFSRRVAIGTSDLVRVPTAVGFFRPAVMLPSWTVKELSPDELHAVILHELAHIERWDDWTNLAQKVLRVLLFFHPAVWWIDSRLSIEREMSCDDAVLALSGDPRKYAECLVSLAEKSYLRRPMAMAQAALGRVKDTAARIAKILDGKDREQALSWKPVVVTATSFLLLAAVGVEHTPELVGFKDSGSTQLQSAAVTRTIPAPVVTLASARTTESIRTRVAKAPRRVKRTIKNQPIELARREGRETNALSEEPAVVNASERTADTAQFMYVVLQTHEIDDSGAMLVTTAVWRIRVLKPSPKHAVPELNPRTT